MNNARPRSLYGSRVALASGHHLATQAAADALRSGGSLADAAISASAVLTVALPHATSLGGCGMLLYFDAASGQVAGLNGSGRAPLSVTPAHFAGGMPQRGVRACVVPTLARLWARLHERFGKQDWAQLLAPAIKLAQHGVATPEELARNLAQMKTSGALAQQPGFKDLFMPAGKPLAAGDTLVQPQLARVLQTLAEQGEAGFFEGWVASELVHFSQRHGGLLAREDFVQAQADWVQPWSCPIGAVTVHAMPPNSVGALMLRQLEVWHAARCVTGSTVADLNPAADVEHAIAVIHQEQKWIGDAQRTPITPAQLGLGSGGLPACDTPTSKAIRPTHGDTAGIVAMDADGNALAMLQSVFQPFGSGAVDLATGILLNNRMFDFSPEAGQPNSVAAGVRPAHTLNPWLITRHTPPGTHMAGVSPGGISQTTTGFQLIARALTDDARTLGQIVASPRWSLSRTGEVLLEPGIAPEVADWLRTRGHAVVENSEHEFYFGSAKLLRRTSQGWLEAAADSRRQATALAW